MKIWLAEFIGTFMVVFIGCGAAILGLPGVGWIFGFIVGMMIFWLGPVSFAHFNPAVTVGFRVLRLIDNKAVLVYWSAEFAGALSASALHSLIFPYEHNFGRNTPTTDLPWIITGELLGTALLMSVIALVVCWKKFPKNWGAPAIGLTVALISVLIGPYSGGSFNPARSLAPALWGQELAGLWIYFVATPLGAILGATLVRRTLGKDHTPPVEFLGQ